VRAGIGDVVTRRRPLSTEGRMAWLLLLSALPAAVIGAVLSDAIEGLDEKTALIAVMLIVGALVLLWADRRNGHRTAAEWRTGDALIMGGAQALALQPGVSRSGVTMTAALILKFERAEAARIAFLMSIPVIAGAGLYEGAKVVADGGIPSGYVSAFAWGFAASAVTGWLAIWATLKIVRTYTFLPFVIYRIALGVIVLAVLATDLR
jgi:undecaprenyl-diphosphatase